MKTATFLVSSVCFVALLCARLEAQQSVDFPTVLETLDAIDESAQK